MDPQTQVSLAEVVKNIVTQAATLSAIVAPITFGVCEALKKMNFPSRFIGLLTAPIGVLVMFLVQGLHFTSLGILVGILAGLGTSGAYSAVKAAGTPAQ